MKPVRRSGRPPRRSAHALRRSALLLLPALCGLLASCGIPATGVVEAGGPASGVASNVRVYLVLDGALIGVRRAIVAPVDVESALRVLLQGPTDAEQAKRITTMLPLPMALPTSARIPPAATGQAEAPQEAVARKALKVTARDDRVLVELSVTEGELTNTAATQMLCTALGAQRVADPGGDPVPVTVMTPDGRRFEGAGARCPDD
ncbi:hypothetical protein AB0H86_01540 [Streptomyces sp. NPDC050997]|uniref:hypothetical protein n=1 Tax=Streptomyces sp. NPDC050997 TaxID=3155519 RepID=UPI00341F04CD